MEVHPVVIVDSSNSIPRQEMLDLAVALQVQISDHFSAVWDVSATISVADSELTIKATDWVIYLVSKIDVKGVRGYHWVRDNGVPFAKVEINGTWTAVVSHELMEMLVNPYVDRFVPAEIFSENEGDESFFLEVAGPSQSVSFSYEINGITVSNFFYPSYFDLVAIADKQYDHLGVILEPRSILEGGYVSFLDNAKNWWQGFNVQGRVLYKKLKGNKSFSLAELNQLDRAGIVFLAAIGFVLFLFFGVRYILKISKK